MKGFEFLEKHPHYVKKDDRTIDIFYGFVNKSDDQLEKSAMSIHKKAGEQIIWRYWKGSMELRSTRGEVEKLKAHSKWFYELVKEANTSIEKRDRIRNLFK